MANAYDHISISTTDLTETGRIKPDVREKLEFPEPERAPFLRLTNRMGGTNWPNMERQIQTEWDPNRDVTIALATAVGATTPVVSNFEGIVAGDVMQAVDADGNPFNELIRVSATPTTTTVTIVRGFGGTTAIAWTANTKLRKLNTTRSEDDSAPDARQRNTGRETQFVSFIARTQNVSLIMRDERMYGVGEEIRINAQGVREFQRDTEMTLLFSEGNKDTSTSGKTVWSTAGLRSHAIKWNRVEAAGGSLGFDHFVQGIQSMNRLGGPNEKFCFLSNKLMGEISQWPVKLNIARQPAMQDTLGFEINTIKIPGVAGDVHLVVHYEFDDLAEMLVADFRGLSIGNRIGMTIDRGAAGFGIQTPGDYQFKWQMYRAVALQVTMPWAQGIFTNVRRIVR